MFIFELLITLNSFWKCRPSQGVVSSEQKRNDRISAATPSSPSPRSSVRGSSQSQSSVEKPSLKVAVPAGSEIHVPRKPTTPPGSPRPVANVHPKRTLSNPADQPNAGSSPKKGVHDVPSDCSTHVNRDDLVKIQPDLAKEAGESDEIVLYGQARTSWRSAAAVAHFVGDGCMALAQRGRLSALSAVGIYFVAVRPVSSHNMRPRSRPRRERVRPICLRAPARRISCSRRHKARKPLEEEVNRSAPIWDPARLTFPCTGLPNFGSPRAALLSQLIGPRRERIGAEMMALSKPRQVYLCVIATIHAGLSTVSVAGTAVMYRPLPPRFPCIPESIHGAPGRAARFTERTRMVCGDDCAL